ncbi:hypothetical protein ABGB16_20475 [Micromonospora sp. B11E3]|uniref:hypothetical protein n=1 Tax=Micromonospora sp. B11E3 TaxID=3153562 RepID=UPI00325EF73B
MELSVVAALLLGGLFIGWGVGAAYARARRGWKDYQTARRTVPTARRVAWGLIRAVGTRVGVVALLLLGAVAYAAAGPDDDRAGPTPGPSATPSATREARVGR